MQQAGYHHANHLAQQMRTDLDTRNTEMMSIIQTALSHASTAPSCDDTTLSDLTPAHHQANPVATDRGPTMQQAGYHHANHLAQQMRTDLDTRNTEMMSIIQTALSHASTAPSCDDTTLSDLTPAHPQG